MNIRTILSALVVAGLLLAGCRVFKTTDEDAGVQWDEQSSLQLKGVNEPTLSVLFSADGTRIISGWANDTTGIWNATTGELIQKIPLRAEYLSRTTDSAIIVAHDGSALRFVNYETGEVTRTITGIGTPVSYDAASGLVASLVDEATNRVEIRNTATGALVSSFERPRLDGETTPDLTAIAIKPGGEIVTTGFHEWVPPETWPRRSTIRIWDVMTGAALDTFNAHMMPITHLVFGANGTRLFSGPISTIWEAVVRVWDTSTWEQVSATTDDSLMFVSNIASTPDGQYIVVARHSAIYVYDAATGDRIEGNGPSSRTDQRNRYQPRRQTCCDWFECSRR